MKLMKNKVYMNKSKQTLLLLFIGLTCLCSLSVFAHGEKNLGSGASATYLGNEGVLI